MIRIERSAAIALAVAASIALGGCIGTRRGGPGGGAEEPSATPSHVTAARSPAARPSASAAQPGPSASGEELSGTAGPGCGTGEKGFVAHRDQVQDAMTLDGKPLEFTTATVAMRNGSYDTDDAIPGYIGLSKDEVAVNEDRGGKLVLAAKGMTLTALTVGTVLWSSVDFSQELPTTKATPKALTWRLVSGGRIVIIAPTRQGEYMLDMKVNWQTECLQGDGTLYGRILVG
jgi:hypothetical protein